MKGNNIKLPGVLSGVAGEYFVAGELSRRGYLASITLRNTRGVDVLCSNAGVTKSVGIQVKTNRGSSRKWVMNEKAENYFARDLFYVFVNLNDNKTAPDYFVVPSTVAAKYIKEGHTLWLTSPGKRGQAHKETSIRQFTDTSEKYKDRWDLLGLN